MEEQNLLASAALTVFFLVFVGSAQLIVRLNTGLRWARLPDLDSGSWALSWRIANVVGGAAFAVGFMISTARAAVSAGHASITVTLWSVVLVVGSLVALQRRNTIAAWCTRQSYVRESEIPRLTAYHRLLFLVLGCFGVALGVLVLLGGVAAL
jgi:hypothetical protein